MKTLGYIRDLHRSLKKVGHLHARQMPGSVAKRFNYVILITLMVMWGPCALLAGDVQLINASRSDVLLNADWDYYESSVSVPNALDLDQGGTRVDLPHTWNAMDPTDSIPGYRRSASWYRKQVELESAVAGQRYLLYFESANMTADVYINGQHAGGHVGGYLGFEIDVTDLLRTGQANEILVRVDNGINRQIIPSQKADFVLYGGLTRDVFMRIRPENRISSVQIDTPQVTRLSGTALVGVQLERHSIPARASRLEFEIIGKDGRPAAVTAVELGAKTGPQKLSVELPAIKNPALWSPRSPDLYELKVTLKDTSGAVIQRVSENFGFRWFGFSEKGEFMLNGERLLLRGTHRHEEHAGYGAAMPNELHVRDLQMIKEMGANFVRLAHYPQDPVVYETADRLGLILWDELPWCRGGLGDEIWKANTESMLREMISQNRNHPSIMFWSLGNEIYWEPDFEGGGDEEALNEYLQYLHDIANELDPYRLTAIRKYYAGFDIVDVFSPSIWAGWYGGGYHQYEAALLDAQKKYPRLLHMEYGGSSHVGRSDWTPPGGDGLNGGQTSVAEMVNQSGVVSIAKYGDWSESYIVDLFDWHLKISETLPYFSGNAQWAFKDFSTPLRPENPIPYINQKGLVDRQGRPKEAYWVFKSYWTTEPFCRIYGHNWTERNGEPGSVQRVRVYCNTETAQLTFNGERLEKKKKDLEVFPAGGLYWDVKFTEGANSLAVAGRTAGQVVASDSLELQYTEKEIGKLADMRISSKMQDDGLILIEAVAVDNKGRRVLSSRERVYFSHTNVGTGGRLLESYGTPDKSAIIEMANGRATILFAPSGDGKQAIIEIRSQSFKGKYITLP